MTEESEIIKDTKKLFTDVLGFVPLHARSAIFENMACVITKMKYKNDLIKQYIEQKEVSEPIKEKEIKRNDYISDIMKGLRGYLYDHKDDKPTRHAWSDIIEYINDDDVTPHKVSIYLNKTLGIIPKKSPFVHNGTISRGFDMNYNDLRRKYNAHVSQQYRIKLK